MRAVMVKRVPLGSGPGLLFEQHIDLLQINCFTILEPLDKLLNLVP
jgi:hypothetical protein